ncbi:MULTISPECIES: hypothetical protein [unclassified Bifidobacterium]|nr:MULTISPECIES: hypothetical protein [unclassified Bifidobacterium]
MKLSKAQNDWVKQLAAESTSRERDDLKRKEEKMTGAHVGPGGMA